MPPIEPANPPAYKSALTCVREAGAPQVIRPAETEATEEEVIDVEVKGIVERIISDWRQLHQSLMHASPVSPEERLPKEEEPIPGPALIQQTGR